MEYVTAVLGAAAFVEENLRGELDAQSVAASVGYSQYHFARIFRSVTGMSVGDYIRARRLSEAVKAICLSDSLTLLDAALEFGFNSAESFLRAFRSEHGILPSEYRAARNSLKLTEPFSLKGSGDGLSGTEKLAARIVPVEAFTVIAYPSDEDIPPKFWNKYNTRGYSGRLSGSCEEVPDYGVCIWNTERCRLDYFIGIDSRDAHGDISNTVRLEIPGGLYLFYDTPPSDEHGFVNVIRESWDRLADFIRENGFERTGGYELECYREIDRTFTERIMIPIKERTK